MLSVCPVRSCHILTDAEYKIKSGKTVEVQTMVEKPHENFIARCNSSEAEQIVYGETRMSCIKETTRNLTTATNANEIVDSPRFFHGDSPARQFESGQQKGATTSVQIVGAMPHG